MRIGLAGLLALLFVTLKLLGVIAWSWLWVLSPLWIGALVFVAFAGIGLLLALLAVLSD